MGCSASLQTCLGGNCYLLVKQSITFWKLLILRQLSWCGTAICFCVPFLHLSPFHPVEPHKADIFPSPNEVLPMFLCSSQSLPLAFSSETQYPQSLTSLPWAWLWDASPWRSSPSVGHVRMTHPDPNAASRMQADWDEEQRNHLFSQLDTHGTAALA